MKARIKSNGKIVEVVSRFMPKKRNAPSRDWVCNLSDGTCIDENQLEYIDASESLEEAAEEYADGPECSWVGTTALEQAFKAGAEWMADHFEKERLRDCDDLTPEDAQLEDAFVESHFKKNQRTPTFVDAINYGMDRQKEQMLKDAVECVVCAGMEGNKWIMSYIGDYESMVKTCKAGDKVRIIIIKEKEDK